MDLDALIVDYLAKKKTESELTKFLVAREHERAAILREMSDMVGNIGRLAVPPAEQWPYRVFSLADGRLVRVCRDYSRCWQVEEVIVEPLPIIPAPAVKAVMPEQLAEDDL